MFVLDYTFKTKLSPIEGRKALFFRLLKKQRNFIQCLHLWQAEGETSDSFADTFRKLEREGIVQLTDKFDLELIFPA